MIRSAVIALGLLVAAGAGGAYVVQSVLKPPSPAPTPVLPESILAGVSKADAAVLRDFYAAMADIVVRDGKAKEPVVRGTLDLRNRHQQALALAFANTALVGKYEGLGARLDAYLLEAIGKTDTPLTDELRQRAAKAFSAIR